MLFRPFPLVRMPRRRSRRIQMRLCPERRGDRQLQRRTRHHLRAVGLEAALPMDPTPDQVARVLKHVHYEIESLLLTPQYEQWNKALEESVYFRKMAHCRVLYG